MPTCPECGHRFEAEGSDTSGGADPDDPGPVVDNAFRDEPTPGQLALDEAATEATPTTTPDGQGWADALAADVDGGLDYDGDPDDYRPEPGEVHNPNNPLRW